MHIGLNLVYLTPGTHGGLDSYPVELIPRMIAMAPQHRFTIFTNVEANTEPPWKDRDDTIVVPVRPSNRIEWVRGEQLLLPPLAKRAGVELLASLASTAPAWGHYRQVVTIHDLIYRTFPEAHAGLRAYGMRILVPLAARRADRIITVSEATKRDLVEHLRTRPEKIDVVPPGLGWTVGEVSPLPEAELRVQLEAGARPIVLSVAAKKAHKNILRLLGAIALIPPSRRPLLVLPGGPTPHELELKKRATELGITDDVRFLGWISIAELEGLYDAATCVVQPSLAEGFGTPSVEAMGRGAAVACAAGGALAETAGENALKFDPTSEAAIAAAITRLLDDSELRAQLQAAGPARAAQFRWEDTAAGMLASYERAMASA